MSETKFTPGPWRAGRNPAMATVLDGHEGKAIYPKDSYRHIAWANVFDEDGEFCMDEALANAALIAAAPEMYAMLSDLATCGAIVNSYYTARIQTLLAKARGEETR